MLAKLIKQEKDFVYLLGHSSVMLRMSGLFIFLDPIWGVKPYGDNWLFKPEQINPFKELKGSIPGYSIVSHIHADHCNHDILKQIDRFVLIKDNIDELYEKIKDLNVILYKEKEWLDLNGCQVMFFSHPINNVDSACVVRSNNMTVWFGNDCFMDELNLNKIKKLVGPIDIALIPYSFVHFYPEMQNNLFFDDKHKEHLRLKKQSLDQAKMFMDIIKPKITVPIGNSLFYIDGYDHPLNKYLARPHELEGALPLIAGDYVLSDGTHSEPISREGYEFILQAQPPLDIIRDRLKKSDVTIKDHYFRINDVLIDPEKLTVSFVKSNNEHSEKDYHWFSVEPREFHKWITGEITFEEVLGSRRFTYVRNPDVYKPGYLDFIQRIL